MKKEIAKIYAKREKAHRVLLECDKKIDDILRKLYERQNKLDSSQRK